MVGQAVGTLVQLGVAERFALAHHRTVLRRSRRPGFDQTMHTTGFPGQRRTAVPVEDHLLALGLGQQLQPANRLFGSTSSKARSNLAVALLVP